MSRERVTMIRLMWILIAAAACMAGCTPSYRVHVNTYSDLAEPIDQSAPIYVASDPNSQNPILRRQIATKIRDLLEGNGHNPVEKLEAAAYVLTFEMGMDSERVLEYAPLYRPYGGYYGGYHRGLYGPRFGWGGFGYTTYMPYIETVYTHWLRMRLYSARDADQKLPSRQTVWLGEAVTGTGNPDLREAVDYLLAACLEYFPIDTKEWVVVTIKRDDPRILGIRDPNP
jgi:hypothetical protein